MKEYLPLEKEDFRPYSPKKFEVAGRIFKNQKWFAGNLNDIVFSDLSALKVRLESITSYIKNLDSDDPEDFGESIIKVNDMPLKGTFGMRSQPFTLNNAERLVIEPARDDVLVIRFTGGAVVLSKRTCDLLAVKEILGRAEAIH